MVFCRSWSPELFYLSLCPDPWPPHSRAPPSWLFCLESTSGLELRALYAVLFRTRNLSEDDPSSCLCAELLTSAVCVVWSGLLGFRWMLIWVIERTFICQLGISKIIMLIKTAIIWSKMAVVMNKKLRRKAIIKYKYKIYPISILYAVLSHMYGILHLVCNSIVDVCLKTWAFYPDCVNKHYHKGCSKV